MTVPTLDPPPDDALAGPFWAAIERHQLALPRCSACHRYQWYPDAAGPDCAGAAYEWVPVPPTGTVHTMTRVHRSFLPEPDHALPFVVGFVELDGVEGVRLVANFDDDPALAIGARVAARFVEVNGSTRPVFRVLAR